MHLGRFVLFPLLCLPITGCRQGMEESERLTVLYYPIINHPLPWLRNARHWARLPECAELSLEERKHSGMKKYVIENTLPSPVYFNATFGVHSKNKLHTAFNLWFYGKWSLRKDFHNLCCEASNSPLSTQLIEHTYFKHTYYKPTSARTEDRHSSLRAQLPTWLIISHHIIQPGHHHVNMLKSQPQQNSIHLFSQ